MMGALCPASSATIPGWWADTGKPSTRIEGEKLASTPAREAEGELMQARYYAVQGDLPRELRHLRRFFSHDPKDPVLLCLGWHEQAAVSRQLGAFVDAEEAISGYGRSYNHDVAVQAGLESPKVLEAWRLIDKGRMTDADGVINNLANTDQAKTDDSIIAALGLLRCEMEGRTHRDPKSSKEALLKLMDENQLGPDKFLSDPNLVVAAVVIEERLFQPDQALQLISAASRKSRSEGREIVAAVIPETEMARNAIMQCRWDDASSYLAKAQKILLTYPPGIRQEAGKNLEFAVADYYLATGHPNEALVVLERLQTDFLRPGFTTQRNSYYLAGLHLRIRMASDRILRLQMALVTHAPLPLAAKALPDLGRLSWHRFLSGILFRENLTECIKGADRGCDIGTLIFVPAWMLPEMENILGKGTFGSLFSQFRPEGRRLNVLQPLLTRVGHLPQDTPVLLRSLFLARGENISDRVRAWETNASATLLAGTELPLSKLPDQIPACGWTTPDQTGLSIGFQPMPSNKMSLSIKVKGEQKVLESGWPETLPGKIEQLNGELLNSDPKWGRDRQLTVEGRNIGTQN
jgi:hypothetical protein